MTEIPLARVREVFEGALDLPEAERRAYLARECGSDTELRDRVDALLAAAERDDAFLSEPTAAHTGSRWFIDTAPGAITESAGSWIGPYKLLEQVGEGGFGTVFMAEQEQPVRRRVALKIIKAGMDTRQVIARFEAERQALAMMDHPGIARVLDAGATGSGRPYFVMELVRGDPITVYCDRNALTTAERLRLFTQVCHAVQHAHQKGVIHRDLKPANVLVTVADGKPVPKVIDFGIAKAIETRLTEKTLFTELRALLGTPAYMSPEQAQVSGVDIDTRSDVYSLGVLLYELLTGTTPFDTKSLMAAGLAEIQRIIREVEPEKPSTRISTSRANQSELAAQRQTDPGRLSALIRGDLDWIVMKALEKDRTRRYQTATDFAADVERHLAGEAVLAAPPSRAYRVRKFVRRHRVGATASAFVVLSLAGGVVGTTLGLVRAERRRVEAEKAREQTQQVSEFHASMLRGIDILGMGQGIKDRVREQVQEGLARQYVGDAAERRKRTPEEIEAALAVFDEVVGAAKLGDVARGVVAEFVLARAAEALEEQFADQPLVRAQVHSAIGTTYGKLALHSAGEAHLKEALAIRERELGEVHELVAYSLQDLGELHHGEGNYGAAEPLFRRAIDIYPRVHGEKCEHLATALAYLARVTPDPAEAEQLNRRALAIRRELLGDRDPYTAESMADLAATLASRGDITAAEALYTEALAILHEVYGEKNPLEPRIRNDMALMLWESDPESSERLLREVIEMRRARWSGDPELSLTLNDLGMLLQERGGCAEAEELFLEALEMQRKLLGDENRHVAHTLNNLSRLYLQTGNAIAAEARLKELLAICHKVFGADHQYTVSTGSSLGELLCLKGDYDAAEAVYRGAVDSTRRSLGERQPPTDEAPLARALMNLGRFLITQGKHTEAEPVLQECLAIRERALPPDSPDYWLVANTRSMLGGAIAGQSTALLASDASAPIAKLAEAEPLLLGSGRWLIENAERIPEHVRADRLREAMERIVETYETWDSIAPGSGKAEQAAAWRAELERKAGP